MTKKLKKRSCTARPPMMMFLLRAGAIWAIRRSSSCEDLSHRRSRWLVNRVLDAASHSRITTTLTSTFQLQQFSPMCRAATVPPAMIPPPRRRCQKLSCIAATQRLPAPCIMNDITSPITNVFVSHFCSRSECRSLSVTRMIRLSIM
jgi:hypothetical protein